MQSKKRTNKSISIEHYDATQMHYGDIEMQELTSNTLVSSSYHLHGSP